MNECKHLKVESQIYFVYSLLDLYDGYKNLCSMYIKYILIIFICKYYFILEETSQKVKI